MLLYLKNILQLLLAPSRGWEDVSVSTEDVHKLVMEFLFPLIGVSALSVFFRLIFDHDVNFPSLIVNALVVFVSFFATYFLAVMMFKSFFYHFCEGEPNMHKATIVIAYTIALLAITEIVCNVMPVNLGLKYLLPLAIALIMWKADVYLRVRSDMNFYFIIFVVLTTIAPPIIIQTLFGKII